MLSALTAPEVQSEFFAPNVLLITGILIVALWQLSGAPTNIIHQPSSNINPFSLISLIKSIGSTARAIQLTSIGSRGSLTAKLYAGFFSISYLGFSWLPRIIGKSEILPDQIGIRISDFFNLTIFAAPPLDYSLRFVFHLFYICPLKLATFSTIFYWIAFIPACFYLTFTLLDGAFIGGGQAHATTATPFVNASPLSQFFSNTVLVLIANFFCVSTALHFSRLFTIFQLPVPNVFYGPEPLLFALFVLLMYKNPVSLFTITNRNQFNRHHVNPSV